jgi:hypothetical protein
LTRETFADLGKPVLRALEGIFLNFREVCAKNKYKIDAVESIGGGCRIPSIHQLIVDIFKLQPGRSMMPGECISVGCAIKGALGLKKTKIGQIYIYDQLYSQILAQADGELIPLFEKGAGIPDQITLPSGGDPKKILQFFEISNEPNSAPNLFAVASAVPGQAPTQDPQQATILPDGCLYFGPGIMQLRYINKLSEATIMKYQALDEELERVEFQIISGQNLQNTFESYFYDVKAKLKSSEFQDFMNPSILPRAFEIVQEIDQWLSHHPKMTEEDIKARLKTLQDVLEEPRLLYAESEQLKKDISHFRELLLFYQKQASVTDSPRSFPYCFVGT